MSFQGVVLLITHYSRGDVALKDFLTLKGTAAPSGRADPAGRASQAQAHKDTAAHKLRVHATSLLKFLTSDR